MVNHLLKIKDAAKAVAPAATAPLGDFAKTQVNPPIATVAIDEIIIFEAMLVPFIGSFFYYGL